MAFGRMQESGLVVVILLLGVLLTVFSGSVQTPVFAPGPDGLPQRVYTTNASGESVPATVEKNKFLNAQNLAQLAKDTSFIAIMAVGMSVVIIAGGIDLSVGAIYALASVLGALTLREFGPGADHILLAPWVGVSIGAFVCIGVATLCGLINGGLIVDRKSTRLNSSH